MSNLVEKKETIQTTGNLIVLNLFLLNKYLAAFFKLYSLFPCSIFGKYLHFCQTQLEKKYRLLKTYSFKFLTCETELVLFSGAGKFCLANGQRHPTCDVKSDVIILNFRSDITY